MEFDVFKGEENYESYAAGDTIFTEGEPGERMFALQEGEVDILVGDHLLDTLSGGDIFGEMALLRQTPRSATARARTDCRVIPVDQRRFKFLVQQTPMFAIQVMQVMAERLRRTIALQS